MFFWRENFKYSLTPIHFLIFNPKLALSKLPSVFGPFSTACFVTAASGSYWQDTTGWRGYLKGWREPPWRCWMCSTTSSWSCRQTSWWRQKGKVTPLFWLVIQVVKCPPVSILVTHEPFVWTYWWPFCPRFLKKMGLSHFSDHLVGISCRVFTNPTALRREVGWVGQGWAVCYLFKLCAACSRLP